MMQNEGAARSRIVLANRPRLFRDLLSRYFEQVPELEVVGETECLDDLPMLIERRDVEWLIAPLETVGEVIQALAARPGRRKPLAVLALSADGSRIQIESPGHSTEWLQDLSLQQLVAVLRSHY